MPATDRIVKLRSWPDIAPMYARKRGPVGLATLRIKKNCHFEDGPGEAMSSTGRGLVFENRLLAAAGSAPA